MRNLESSRRNEEDEGYYELNHIAEINKVIKRPVKVAPTPRSATRAPICNNCFVACKDSLLAASRPCCTNRKRKLGGDIEPLRVIAPKRMYKDSHRQ